MKTNIKRVVTEDLQVKSFSYMNGVFSIDGGTILLADLQCFSISGFGKASITTVMNHKLGSITRFVANDNMTLHVYNNEIVQEAMPATETEEAKEEIKSDVHYDIPFSQIVSINIS